MSNSIMRKIAKFIVEKHIIIMLLFVVLVIYSALSISKVRVNEDITALLPPKTATRRGLTVMENEFTAFASANVMVLTLHMRKPQNLPRTCVKLKMLQLFLLMIRRNTMRPHLRFSRLLFLPKARMNVRLMRLNRLRTAFRIMK